VLSGAISIPGASLTGATNIAAGATIKAPQTQGHLKMTMNPTLGVDSSSQDISVSLSETTLTASTFKFKYEHTGGFIEWADGSLSVITDVPSQDSATATVWNSGLSTVGTVTAKFYTAGAMLTPRAATFKDRIVLTGWNNGYAFNPVSAVTIDVTQMRVDGGTVHNAKWTFPNPGPPGQLNVFVGDKTIQTLYNKVTDRLRATVINYGPRVSVPDGVTADFLLGSNAVSGSVRVVVSGSYGGSILAAVNLQGPSAVGDNFLAFVTLTPANVHAAGVTGVYVNHVASSYEFEIRTSGSLPPNEYRWNYHVIGTDQWALTPGYPRVL
jgi:hypothetical protein